MNIENASLSAYESAWHALTTPAAPGRERRGAERTPFQFVQRVAAYDGQERLSQFRFFPVHCHDISRSGFSFTLPDRVDFSRLVVELGSPDQRMYFLAEIVNYRFVSDSPDVVLDNLLKNAAPLSQAVVMIGCRFLEKLEFPAE